MTLCFLGLKNILTKMTAPERGIASDHDLNPGNTVSNHKSTAHLKNRIEIQ